MGVDLFGVSASAFCGYVLYISRGIADIDSEKINIIEKTLYTAVVQLEADISYFKTFIIVFLVLAIIRIALRDIYYIDAILSSALAIATVYMWNAEKISVFGAVLCFMAVLYAIGRIAVMLFCRARVKGEEG